MGTATFEPLPVFRYYPDPIGTGAFIADPDTPCLGCNRIRGYVYTGPVTTEKHFMLERHICPWCIADGTAAKRFGATFNDTGTADDIPDEARDEIEHRTPGYMAWQQERWLSCCRAGAAFLGLAVTAELERDFPKAIPVVKKYIREEYSFSPEEAEEFYSGLKKDDMPTAYVFRCLKCNKFQAYVDET